MITTTPNPIHPLAADSPIRLRLRSGRPWRPQLGLLLAGIALGWLLHSAFHHLTSTHLIP